MIVETVRQPDVYVGFLLWGTTMGQWLSLPLLAFGLYMIRRALRRAPAGAP